ncbi:MAG: class I SAM-dependent methyltransferase, partial [Chloroflexi bacterium]|nr:class I SAM-dependent methyltransferase [Chloroflexota bacterium]
MDRSREPLPTFVRDTPELPSSFGNALDQGLADLDLTLSSTAREAIEAHARLLLAWTTAINLTAIRDPASVALAHVVDSLSGVAVLRRRGVDRYIDLGSGGGYPGLPIAAALPAARALLLEPIGKKAAFL